MRFYDIGEGPLMGLSEKHIAPLVLGGIIAAGASLAGNAIGASSQNKANQTNIDINRENNAFNAEQAQIQRDWQEKMWGMNNSYNSPNAMISRGLNPFVQGSAAMAGSKSPASGGAAASAAPPPSVQAFRPDFSDVGSALASMAQARASMLNAEQNAALTPYKIQQILGDTNYRNIGIGESGYWNKSTGRESALLDQSKEYQELKNMEFAGRLTRAQEAQILLDSEAQQVLNKYLDEQQQADLFIKGQTLANLYAQGALTEAQYKTEMAKAVKLSVETNGLRIQNRIASETADSLIFANIQSNRSQGLSSLWDSKNTNVLKNIEYSKDKALRDYYKWSSKQKQKDVNSYELRNAVDYGTRIFQGIGNSIGRK
jgi:transcription initiation factor TFIIIB Brf1 subunit/transcription initiation factor TFIIB